MDVKEYNREYAIGRRQRQREDGKCPICSTGKPNPGYVTCASCIEKGKDRYRAKTQTVES